MSDLTHISETVDEEFNRLVALYHADAEQYEDPLDLALTWVVVAGACLGFWALLAGLVLLLVS